MKYLRFSLLAVLAMMAGLLQAQNVLRVDSVEGPAGKTVMLPIVLENQSDIAGVQFDIAVPYQLAVDDADKVIVNLSKTRAEGFNVATRYRSTTYNYIRPGGTGSQYTTYYSYRVIIYSDDNRLVLGNEGTLLTLQLVTDGELTDKTELPVTLSNVSLSDRDMVNKLSESYNGLITIKEIPRPDLAPTDVTFTPNSVEPGGQLDVSWKVQNIGTANTGGGWSEEIALVSISGTATKVLTTTHYADSLLAQGEVSRNVSLSLPSLLGIDGIAKVQVTVIPDANAGEHQSLRDNNVARSDNNVQVAKHLTLEVRPNRVSESYYGQRVAITLTRSGSWNEAQSFRVTCTDSKGQPSAETRVPLPEIINILAGQSAAISYLNVTNNSVLDPDTLVHFKVEPINTTSGYAAVEADLVIEDDEFPALTVTPSKNELKEGTDHEFRLTVETQRAPVSDLTVTITSENTRRFTFPQTITIPAGETTAQAVVTVVDDDQPNGTLTNQFTVSAPRHVKGTTLVTLEDDDLPVLELSLTPTTVQESDGPVCVAGVLKRLSNKDKKVTVRLTDDASGGLYYGNRQFTLDKGVEEVRFNFGPVDNQEKEGDRTYTITAAVWLSSCSCDATGESAGHVSAQLTVLDDDGDALRISSASGTVKEGGTTTLTITRNNAATSDLTVTISSDFDAELEYDHTVVIPAGQKSVSVEVRSLLNNVSGDSHTVIFTVTTEGYASGTCWVMVTDQTLPDAVFKEVSVSPEACLVGDPVTMTLKVANEGNNAALPASTTIDIFEQGIGEPLASFVIDTPLPVGQSRTIEKQLALPKSVAIHRLYAVLNRNNTVQELSTTNNTSASVAVEVSSPFMAELSTDKTKYNQNDVVIFSGQLNGRDTENAELDLYIVGDGVRQVQRVRAAADGRFDYRWPLSGAFIGHCIAGVCYPDAGSKAEITAFDVYGLRRTTNGYIKFQPTVGVEVQSAIQLENPGVLPLTGMQVQVVEKPENFEFDVTIPETIAGGEKPAIAYSFTPTAPSTGSDWQAIRLNVTSNEGVELPITIYLFARMAQANLITPNQRITTTMTKGQVREYPVTLINNGQGSTGTITLALPDWIKCAQGATLAGINKGDTATIVLQFKPTDDMQLNVPVTGTIGYNVQYGNSTYSNFSITPVSDQTGTLVVEVADEYTYYTEERPHVKNAEVVLRNSVTNAIVTIDGQPAQGRSGEDGCVTFENLPEGYYKLSVTADDHDSYSNNIIVDPGVTTTKVVNLSVQAIKVSWTVEETEVEDVYEIVTTMTYETNVPAPVVELISPSRLPLDSLAVGESFMFYAIATNKGLINAENAEFQLPDTLDNKYVFEPQVENMGLTIAPQQSYVVPVKVTRLATTSDSRMRAGSSGGCTDKVGMSYEWKCGADRKWQKVTKPFTYKSCPGGIGGWGPGGGGGGGGGGLGSPGGGGGGGYSPSTYVPNVSSSDDCDPCLNELGSATAWCLAGFTPAGCAAGLAGCGMSIGDSSVGIFETVVDCVLGVAGCVPVASTVASVISCIKGLGKAGWKCLTNDFSRAADMEDDAEDETADAPRAGRPMKSGAIGIIGVPTTRFSWVNSMFECLVPVGKSLDGMVNYITEVMGDTLWLDVKAGELESLLAVVKSYNGQPLVADELKPYKPANITDSLFNAFIDRCNRTRQLDIDGILPADTNFIHRDVLVAGIDSINSAEALAVKKGYINLTDWWDTVFGTFKENIEGSKGSVCASISLQIKQEMVLTRQAFRGTLTVFNGHETTAMTNMKLNLLVSDMYNNVATAHEFQINAESLKNMDGPLALDGGWTLQPNSEGVVTVLFIPTKYAAPTEPVEYSFGGTLSYVDPYSGLEVTRDLYPVTLTVKPSPDLVLTYFMQRDLYGDDPLTEDIIEPVEPGEFALLINNKGYGAATNVRMTTNQPEVVENEKGLFIDFEIISSQVNGGPAALSFGQTIANTLGDIPAHSQTYAQWWLQSSLLGHFTSYDLSITHVTSYGNEDLSLVDIENSSIHELIHGFTPPCSSLSSSPQRAFLCNDVEDAHDLPDQVYFTDATQAAVTVAQSTSVDKKSGYEYEVFILPSQAGWTYATMLDPTVGRQKLLKVVRKSDGLELPADNVWQTSRSMRDGMEWLRENRLHFVGLMPATGETYLLTYEQRPDVELDFQFLQLQYDPEFEKEGLVTADVNEVTITFNKPILPETFDFEDVTYQVQGEKRDLSQVEGLITPKEGQPGVFTINLGSLNPALPNGYYVLSVQGSGITDGEGYQGLYGRKLDWVLFRGGLIQLNARPFPAVAGDVTFMPVGLHQDGSRLMEPAAGTVVPASVSYGQSFQLTATPAEGYEFVNWTLNGDVVSTEPVFETTANSDLNIVANFKKKQYLVEVLTEGNGSLRGNGTGHYDYETELAIEAVPGADFILKHWVVDGTVVEPAADNTLVLTVKKAAQVRAVFVRDIYEQTLTLARGWNWVSTYLREQQSLGEMAQYADRLLDQQNELFRDPQYGLVGAISAIAPGVAYKVDASARFSRTMRGHLLGDADQATLSLKPGWNWIAYPYFDAKAVADVLVNAEEGDVLTSHDGGFTSFEEDSWAGTLSEFVPGSGYLYKSASEKQLTFCFNSAAAGSRSSLHTPASTLHSPLSTLLSPHRYPSTMNITARIFRDGYELPASHYTVYAMAPDGELRGVSQCVGASHYLTVYGDDAVQLTFVIEQDETGDTFVAHEQLTFVSDVVGSRSQPFAFTLGTTTGVDQLADDSRPVTVYTLAGVLVSRDASLKTLRSLPRGVYIVNGRKCFVR